MIVTGIRSRLVRWQIAGEGAARGRTERTAILVEVELASGAIGLGEAAPLPGMSLDSLEDAGAGIDAFVARVHAAASVAATAVASVTIEPTVVAIAALAASITRSPSARFAIETALLSAHATESGRSLADLLVVSPVDSLPCAVVVDDPDSARRAVAEGARCLKLKVGPTGDLERVIAIHHAAPDAMLRIDANRSWSRALTRPLLHALADLPIDFVEEPCPDAHELLAEPLPLAIALDESLAALTDDQLAAALRSPGLATLVLKPTLLGGHHACLTLAARAAAAGKDVVVTHALEGPIGTAACAELALAIAGQLGSTTPAGLAPHAALAGWSHVVAQVGPTTLRRSPLDAALRLDDLVAPTGHPTPHPMSAEFKTRDFEGAAPTPDPMSAESKTRPVGAAALDIVLPRDPMSAKFNVREGGVAAPERDPMSAEFKMHHGAATTASIDRILASTRDRAAPTPGIATFLVATQTDPVSAGLEPREGAASIPSATPTDPMSADFKPLDGTATILVATPTAATIDAIRAALDAREPLALLHHRLPAPELARQRGLVEAAQLPADTAFVLFTSGSTGPARGVVLSRAAIDAAAAASAAHLGWQPGDRWLLALSTAHAGGLAIVVRCHAAGVPIEILDGDFDRARCALLLERCTLASFVPTQLAALLDDPAWRPPARLRAVLLGGAAASRALLESAAARGVPFLTSYGLTETFGQIATAPLALVGDAHAPLELLAGVQIIAGTRAEPAPIEIRAPMLATAYLEAAPTEPRGVTVNVASPGLDARAIAPRFVTADLGFVAGGALHVVGRIDDVIISGGEKVHPSVVEAELTATPGVRSACVFAVPDPRWGQTVGAVIAVDDAFDEQCAVARWTTTLAPHARPRQLAIAPALPLLPSGKVDRHRASSLTRHPLRYPR